MKTYCLNCYCLPLVVIGLAAGFFSCGSTPAKNASAAPAETVYRLLNTEQSVPLFPSRSEKAPRMNFELTLLEVAGHEREVEFFNKLLYSETPARYTDTVIAANKQRYTANMELAGSQNPLPANLNWEYIERMSFDRFKDRGMVIEREKYTYSGGAHGEETKEYFVIDLAELKVLALEDFFRDVNDPRLKDIVARELRAYGAEAGVFFNAAPEPSRDFFISGEGMGMHWNPAEIASHSGGSIDIVIPWRALSPLLKHETMELMTGFGIYLFM